MKIKFLLPLILGFAAVCSAQIFNGGGGVSCTGGTCTNNAAVFGGGSSTIKVDSAITTDGSGNLTAATVKANSFTTNGTAAGCINLNEAQAQGNNVASYCVPSSAFSNASFIWPVVDGSANNALTTNGAGVWTFNAIANSVFGRTGAVVATSGDYTLDQIGNPAATKNFALGSANDVTFTGNATTSTNNLVTCTDTANNTGTGACIASIVASGSSLANALLVQNNPSTSQTLTTLAGVTLQAATAADATHAYNSPPLIFNGRAAHGGTDANQNWQIVNVMGSNANDPTSFLTYTFSGTSTGATGVQIPKVGINAAPSAGVQLRVVAGSASTSGLIVQAASSPTIDVFEVNNNGGAAQTYTDSQFHWAHPPDIAALTSDFTDSSGSAALQNITGLSFTLPQSKAQNIPFECHMSFTQATNVSDQFGIQFNTNAPTRADAKAEVTLAGPGAVTPSFGYMNNLTATTATAIITFTPTAATQNNVDIYGVAQMPSSASSGTMQMMVQQSTAADVIIVKAGSYCKIW